MKMAIHLGFLMNTTSEVYINNHFNSVEEGKRMMRQLTIFFWCGMRGFYVSFPLTLYLVGPSYMLAGCIVIIISLIFFLDFPPLDVLNFVFSMQDTKRIHDLLTKAPD